MAGIFLASSLLACLVMASLLQPVDIGNQADKSNEDEKIKRRKSLLLVTATVRQMSKRDQPHP